MGKDYGYFETKQEVELMERLSKSKVDRYKVEARKSCFYANYIIHNAFYKLLDEMTKNVLKQLGGRK